jgi:hypothetical protein
MAFEAPTVDLGRGVGAAMASGALELLGGMEGAWMFGCFFLTKGGKHQGHEHGLGQSKADASEFRAKTVLCRPPANRFVGDGPKSALAQQPQQPKDQ